MEELSQLIARYGLITVFVVVFLKQLGPPLPAFPVLLVAGALSVSGTISFAAALVLAVTASVLADSIWYVLGQRYGYRILRLLCRVSLNADSCVRQSEVTITRWGGLSLVAGKFIPGFSTVAAPLMGALRVPVWQFSAGNIAGAALYAVFALVAGIVFHREVDRILQWISAHAVWGTVTLAVLLAAYVAFKWWRRRQFLRDIDMPRMAVPELERAISSAEPPLLLDARSPSGRAADPRTIPGAWPYGESPTTRMLELTSRERLVIVYCSCPNDATAAKVAKTLLAQGFHRAFPLSGGLDAWFAGR